MQTTRDPGISPCGLPPGVDYTKREVNAVLRRFHDDDVGLRHDLIDSGLMARESNGSQHWRL